ncbi:hypothetical protein [Microbacterium sp.]|uniref:hypothetical protein n=1 Tax=Microbacterium sp. TaxID=51671 RepID=UPI0025EBCEBF|nr:hypothetical protein [Microbacterium sp.]MBT9605907.1 hypothetical protein [Microbacterium sp.]
MERHEVAPEHENQLPDVDAAIEATRHTNEEISTATARAIAHDLAIMIGPEVATALTRFSADGIGTNTELRREYLAVYDNPTVPQIARDMAAWLGSYHVAQENPDPPWRKRQAGTVPVLSDLLWRTAIEPYTHGVALPAYVPADTPAAIIAGLPGRLRPLIDHYGAPMRAFLELPDVNAIASNLQKTFDDFYIGSYADREAAIRGLTELDDWEREIRALCVAHGIPDDAVTIDRDMLWQFISEGWDIVLGDDDQLHAFTT